MHVLEFQIRISNENWVIVGSVAEPTITKFHLSWGENGYAVARITPTRHLSRVAPLDIPLDMFIRRSPPDVAPFERERTVFNQVHASPDQAIESLKAANGTLGGTEFRPGHRRSTYNTYLENFNRRFFQGFA